MTALSPLADKHILIVDDIPSFCQELRGYLKHHCRQVFSMFQHSMMQNSSVKGQYTIQHLPM